MKTYRKIVETTIIDEHNHEEKHIIETLHKIRSWEELTLEEKEHEIERHKEGIYEEYQNYLYENFKCDLDNLRYDFKDIEFEDVCLDSNSQGWWIDRVTKLRYTGKPIEIYGNMIEIEDIDLHIRKYIDKDFDLYINEYNLTCEDYEKIIATKKYQKWINEIKDYVSQWIDRVNDICKEIGSKEYYYPYNYNDCEDKEFLDYYFENEEFEDIETINSEDYC